MAARMHVVAAAGAAGLGALTARHAASRMSGAAAGDTNVDVKGDAKGDAKGENAKKEKADDCVRPACATMKSMLQQSLGVAAAGKVGASAGDAAGAVAPECPVGREELGRATWALLHTTAAWYPDAPSAADRDAAMGLVAALARLYPCTHCAEDFRATTMASPPAVESRAAFAVWLCAQHNLVNKKLGKPTFDCSLPKIDERWREGQVSCFRGQEESAADSLGRASTK